jgi:hypothetical protein
MKSICILGLALLLAACGTTKSEGPARYRAWCATDNRDVGPWRASREEADADRKAHLNRWGWHAVRIDTAN